MTKFTLPALAATALLLASAGSHAAPPAGQDALAGPKIKVDVGGRKLNMYCVGKGSPTVLFEACLLYTSPSPRDLSTSRMPSSA